MESLDCLIVGAGFSGLFMLYRVRELGLSVRVIEAAHDVGGTWYWNRYPGAACDVESLEYSYSFSDELQREWNWSSRYASQPEIFRYLQHVAEKFQLRPHIQFNTRVTSAVFSEQSSRWTVSTDCSAAVYSARFVVMATGCLSSSKLPDIPGLSSFKGQVYRTSEWPHEDVSFEGKRVAVIGTGSSAIQCTPLVAQQARHLYVYQRTPNFSVPAANRPLSPEELAKTKASYPQLRSVARESFFGSWAPPKLQAAGQVSDEERNRQYAAAWERGGLLFLATFVDLLVDKQANDTAADFARAQIRQIVKDPITAEALTPKGYPLGAKRICLDTNYFAAFNRPNVTLVDLRKTPITALTPVGVRTSNGEHEVDCVIFATGFDAMTGALTSVDIRGKGGITLREYWADGPKSYLGLAIASFPNLFTVTGPFSPSVLSNMLVSIEQHVNWIADCLKYVANNKIARIEATPEAERDWVAHANMVANMTLFPHANSWYLGANIPGKPRVFMPYIAGVGSYAKKCAGVAAANYEGFSCQK